MQPSQNTLVTEIGLIAVSVVIVAGAVALRILGYIDNALLLEMIGVVGALWGLNGALKAPSPSQQAQQNAQQAQQNAQNVNLQQLVQYALSVLPGLVQPQAPVAPPQPQQAAPLVMPSTSDPAMTPAVSPAPGTALHALINSSGNAYPLDGAQSVASGHVAHMLATPPEVTLTPAPANASEVEVYRLAGTTPQTQFKSITIPDVSAPYPAVGQGIPLGQ